MTTRSPTPEPTAPNPAAYAGRRIAVGTRHGKQDQLGPAFREVLGADLVVPPDLDTDRFGTFSGEIPRTMPAADAARAKARLAMSITGLPFGLASEASYGPLPGLGWPGHEEILLFCDDEHGFEILEGHRTTEIPGTLRTVAGIDDVPPPLLAGLPDQALIVRPGGDPGPVEAITKGITDPAALRRARSQACRERIITAPWSGKPAAAVSGPCPATSGSHRPVPSASKRATCSVPWSSSSRLAFAPPGAMRSRLTNL